MKKKVKVIFMHAITSVHAGSGSSVSYVDLPVQREVNTDLPVIYASEVRGIFRARYFEEKLKRNFKTFEELKEAVEDFTGVFGGGEDVKRVIDESKENLGSGDEFKKLESFAEPSQSPSSVSFSDARILFFPVRSLKGIFAWVTCPYALKRFKRDLEVFGKNLFGKNLDLDVPDPKEDEAKVLKESELVFKQGGGDVVVFEDFKLSAKEADFNIEALEKFLPDTVDRDFFKKHVAVVSDDVFKDLTVSGMEITPRIRIDKSKGTVAQGGLWYEENVPAEAIFYTLVIYEGNGDFLKEGLVHIGGNESLARGMFRIKVVDGGEVG